MSADVACSMRDAARRESTELRGRRESHRSGERAMSIPLFGGLEVSIRRGKRFRHERSRAMQQKITPNLWFDTEAEGAATFYVSIFENSRIVDVTRYPEGAPGPAGTVMTVEFELDGHRFVGINGGPHFKFDEAVSFEIGCETQDEIDFYWKRLSEDGREGQCGWLKDRYGLSWQVVPTGMEEVLNDPDPERGKRAMQAMLGMSKLDIAALYDAADGAAAT